jgi:nucleotide-binding universal stress UspA family protein
MSRIVGRVVVGVGGSPNSLQALRHAVGLARHYRAVLVPVLAWIPPGGEVAAMRWPAPSLTLVWRQDAERRLLAAFEEGLGGLPPDVEAAPLIVRGETGPALVDVADRESDLLVIGAGRRGRISRLLMSRVPRYCVARAGCTVITVPPPPLAERSSGQLFWKRAPRTPAAALPGRALVPSTRGPFHGARLIRRG